MGWALRGIYKFTVIFLKAEKSRRHQVGIRLG